MGKVASATTVYATAYLTEKGRSYLFNNSNTRFDSAGNDLFAIASFTLNDPDTNYNTVALLQSGDVPDLTGTADEPLKAAADYTQSTFAYFTIDSAALANPLYQTNITNNLLTLNTNTPFPTNSSTDVPPAVVVIPVVAIPTISGS